MERIKKFFSNVDVQLFKRKSGPVVHAAVLDDEILGNVKYHLRINEDGRGTLNLNADKVIYLNRTATDIVRMIMDEATDEEVQKVMTKKYDVDGDEVLEDFQRVKQTLDHVMHETDTCPIVFSGVTPEAAFKNRGVPARVDLALTYRCNNNCGHCYVGREKDFPEMDTISWKKAIDKLYDLGVPHVTLTGGEATLREDITEIIQYTEDMNIVCGLVTNGIKLADNDFLMGLVNAGLDYIQITLESHDATIHNKMVGANTWNETVQGLKNAIATQVYTLTNTTLCKLNEPTIEDTIDFLAEIGLEGTFAMNGLIYSGKGKDTGIGILEQDLEPILDRIIQKAREHDFKFIWYSPTQYCEFNPVIHGLGPKRCSAANISMAIEPNGDVIPCQSYFESIGNILEDPWKKIWNHRLAKDIRKRKDLPAKCEGCDLVETCGGGCPLYRNKFVACMDGRGGM
ncbi:radical SAM protein [Candidatus Bathyarchaeota archaeon]|nr:radical SAM protein [Candidatus Bathyarchaeota archaeon]